MKCPWRSGAETGSVFKVEHGPGGTDRFLKAYQEGGRERKGCAQALVRAEQRESSGQVARETAPASRIS